MRPQSCKSKGRRLQQKVASDIRDAFQHLTEDDCHSTPMGAHGEDVRLSTAARECVNLSIECKNVEKINIWGCLQQCEANAKDGTTPCLVFSRNRSPIYAVVPWRMLLGLHKKTRGRIPPRIRTIIQELSSFIEEGEGEEQAGAEEDDP